MDRLRMIADYLAVSIANAQAFEELTRLKRQLEIENAYLKNDALPPAALALTGDSPCMRTLKEKIRQVACTDVPVLITGEAGSGKEAVAAGIKAGDIIKAVCAVAGGKGGGKPDSAMGGGTDVLKMDNALAIVDDLVAEKLGL
jgi:alanyl-tRNA synthetase